MVLIKDERSLRLGEIIEEEEETVTVHWYGTTSPKDWSRTRWKFYPGWENSSGEIEFVKAQFHGKPATCIVPKSQILHCFTKLNLNGSLPADKVANTLKYTL